MDSATLILAALSTGIATGGQALTNDIIKDAYQSLKVLIQKKVAQKPKVQQLLADYEEDSDTYKKPLEKLFLQENIDQDPEIIEAAQKVLKLTQPQQDAIGKYNVQITGNVQGYAQGDNQTITMNFDREIKEK